MTNNPMQRLPTIILTLLFLTSCAIPKPAPKKDDAMSEAARNHLMIQQDTDVENRKIMEENLKDSALPSQSTSGERGDIPTTVEPEEFDPMLLMDQGRYDKASGKIVPDRMEDM